MRLTQGIAWALLPMLAACAPAMAGHGRASPVSLVETLVGRDRNALWTIVGGLCVRDMREHGKAAPCEQVDLHRGYAVLKDINGATQLLLIPTRRVPGIEDASLLAPGAPNYWQAAWDARALFEQRIGHRVPRATIGLAINSATGRSQDQLHIHVDCLRREVVDALGVHGGAIGRHWSDLPVPLAGRDYRAMRLNGEDLGKRDPFKLLAGDASARATMGLQTLVVAGYQSPRGTPGFVLLAHRADLAKGDRGHGEDLLDHRCKVLHGM